MALLQGGPSHGGTSVEAGPSLNTDCRPDCLAPLGSAYGGSTGFTVPGKKNRPPTETLDIKKNAERVATSVWLQRSLLFGAVFF